MPDPSEPGSRALTLGPRLALGACLGFGALLGLGACGNGPTGSSHPPERILNLYNWADYIGYHTIADFEQATHIKVVLQFYDSNETLEATLMAGHSGYDLVSTTTGFYAHQIRAGAYQPLDRSKLPHWNNLDPAVLALQSRADPQNRYAVPYLHAMNGIAYNVDLIRERMPDAPLDSSAMLFDPKVVARFADCGVSFLDSAIDTFQLALAYLHRDPNSERPEDLAAAEDLLRKVRPYIRTFDSNDYWHQLAAKDTCIAMAWTSDYEVAQRRADEDHTGAHLALILPKEGSNITYNAFLIPASAPHPKEAHAFLDFLLQPKVIAQITNDLSYGNDNLAARPYVNPKLLADPAVYPPPEVRARLYLPAQFSPEYDRLRTRAWTRIKTGQ